MFLHNTLTKMSMTTTNSAIVMLPSAKASSRLASYLAKNNPDESGSDTDILLTCAVCEKKVKATEETEACANCKLVAHWWCLHNHIKDYYCTECETKHSCLVESNKDCDTKRKATSQSTMDSFVI